MAVVHNGIIENYWKLKEELLKEGIQFFFRHGYGGGSTIIWKVVSGWFYCKQLYYYWKKLKGSYALRSLHQAEANKLVCCKKKES